MNVTVLEWWEVVVVPPTRPDHLLVGLGDAGRGDEDAGRRLCLRLTEGQLGRRLQLELPRLEVSQSSPGSHVGCPHTRASLDGLTGGESEVGAGVGLQSVQHSLPAPTSLTQTQHHPQVSLNTAGPEQETLMRFRFLWLRVKFGWVVVVCDQTPWQLVLSQAVNRPFPLPWSASNWLQYWQQYPGLTWRRRWLERLLSKSCWRAWSGDGARPGPGTRGGRLGGGSRWDPGRPGWGGSALQLAAPPCSWPGSAGTWGETSETTQS